MIDFVRRRLNYQLRLEGADPPRLKEAGVALDRSVLTIGFARRFTDYKRPNLLLTDEKRLAAIINNPTHPIQIVAAGKAHPNDEEGKRLIQQFVQFASQPALRRRVVFLSDYDIATAGQMVQGVDLWLNTPRRPWEACGTSGMKVLVNGGVNLSVLDGWWAEAYSPEVGWCIGDACELSPAECDALEARQLYDLLENEIAPEFYERNADGIPVKWIARVRASMSKLAPYFSTNRMLREYVDNIYIPVTRQIRQRTSDNGKTAHDICAWQTAIERSWPDVRFGDLKVQAGENGWLFEVLVYLGDLKPEWVSVELYAEPVDGQDGVRLPMTHGDRLPGEMNAYVYRIEAPATRPSEHYTPRIIPAQPRCRRTPGGHAYPLAALVCAYFFTREREIADNIDSDSF
ncbi:MAG: alpha-glucan family phosphorylase [Dehalococcoidales bacterium]|nr:alpha-glucan family phosphorylase [Dehalococcoidales bacterium]